MGKILKTAAAILAVLLIAAGTVSAQGKKQVEKKITIVSVDENGIEKDTTIISYDTLDFDGDRIIVETEDGKLIHGKGRGNQMIYVDRRAGEKGMPATMKVRQMNQMGGATEETEGVNYHLSVDGVIVNIRAPKEKAKEADLILEEVRKILMKK